MSTTDPAMVRRMITALGRNVQDGDPDDLAALLALDAHLHDVIGTVVAHMRNHQEITWQTIASASGTTRQAAQQRWSRYVPSTTSTPAGDER